MDNSKFLFVYGTLRRGCQMAIEQFLPHEVRYIGRAKVEGALYAVDYYPGLVLNDKTTKFVVGEVYEMTETQRVLFFLDDYEGIGEDYPQPHEYIRVAVEVEMERGGRLKCWTYLYSHPITDKALIESGDYLLYLNCD